MITNDLCEAAGIAKISRPSQIYQKTFVVCLVAHSVGSLIRKVIPSQPNFIEPVIIAFVLYFAFFMIFDSNNKRKLSLKIVNPIVVWGGFLFIYAIAALIINPLISLMAVSIRILPLIMVFISFRAVHDKQDLKFLTSVLGGIAVALVPFAVASLFFGYQILPGFLRQIEELETTKQFRAGLYCFAGIYNSNATLSTVMLATFFCSLVMIGHIKEKNYSMVLYAASSFFLIMISTRRGTLFAALVGLVIYMMLYYVKNKHRGLFGIVGIAIVMMTNNISDDNKRDFNVNAGKQVENVEEYYKRQGEFIAEANFDQRFNDIFIGFTKYWIKQTPIGTYLGFGGREAQVFNGPRLPYMVMEVGSALLIAETGIMGGLLFPIIIGILLVTINRSSKKNYYRKEILLLMTYCILFFILFYTKEAAMMISPVTPQLFFWSAFGICAALIRAGRLIDAKNKAAAADGYFENSSGNPKLIANSTFNLSQSKLLL